VSVDALIGLNSTRLDKIALPRKRAARERKIGLLVVSQCLSTQHAQNLRRVCVVSVCVPGAPSFGFLKLGICCIRELGSRW